MKIKKAKKRNQSKQSEKPQPQKLIYTNNEK